MRRTNLFTAALLALSLAPALHAQQGSYGDPRYRDRYPNSGQMERVAALAHEIDETATYIHRLGERNNRRPSRSEARMLAELHGLNESAAHFHDQVESNRRDPRHTADDFAALEDAFYQVDEALRSVRPRGYIDRGMERIYTLMNELSRYYGRGGYGRWGDPQRFGRDRGYDGHSGRDGRDGRYDGRYPQDGDDDDHGYRPPRHDQPLG